MQGVGVVAAALAVTALAAGGVAGIATGWVAPWARSRVLRPRMWGYGTLAGAAGAALWIFVGPLGGPPHGWSAFVASAGLVLFLAALVIQFLALRLAPSPSSPRTAPTKTAS